MNLSELSLGIHPSWKDLVETWKGSEDFIKISEFLHKTSAFDTIYPLDPFVAFKELSLNDVRVVILGQDPYHGEGQAHGLAFSVAKSKKIPPSLKNIFKEISRTQQANFAHGCLRAWQKQGVLLLNTTLTVSHGAPASHSKKGWESLTDAVIQEVVKQSIAQNKKIAFLLWGAHAQSKENLISKTPNILVLKANHPSPFSALRPPLPFLGCDHFKKLEEFGIYIDWSIIN